MDSFVVQNGVQTALPKLVQRNPKGITKPVHWGCKGVKKSLDFYLKSQAMVFVDGSKGL
jgi:hypothetical protein